MLKLDKPYKQKKQSFYKIMALLTLLCLLFIHLIFSNLLVPKEPFNEITF